MNLCLILLIVQMTRTCYNKKVYLAKNHLCFDEKFRQNTLRRDIAVCQSALPTVHCWIAQNFWWFSRNSTFQCYKPSETVSLAWKDVETVVKWWCCFYLRRMFAKVRVLPRLHIFECYEVAVIVLAIVWNGNTVKLLMWVILVRKWTRM